MLSSIDHIVIVTPSLDSAIRDFEQAGFRVTPGGRHTSGKSMNALVPLADGTYFELYAFLDPAEPSEHPRWPLLRHGGGLADFHLLTDQIEDDSRRLNAAGLRYSAPYPLGRVRPDGQACAWRLSASPWPEPPFLPYLIEDSTPRTLRVPGGGATDHPNGVRGVDTLTIAVADLDRTARAWEVLLDTAAAETVEDRAFGAQTVAFRVGPATVRLAQAKAGPIAARLAETGESIYQVALTGGTAAPPGTMLARGIIWG